mgnify:CR=1 FL=1
MQRFNEYNFQGFNGYSDEEIKILENYLTKGMINSLEDAKFILTELDNNKDFYQDFINSSRTYYSWYIWISFIVCISFYITEIYFFFYIKSLESLTMMLGVALLFPSLANPLSETVSQKINFHHEFKKLKEPLEIYIKDNEGKAYSLGAKNSLETKQVSFEPTIIQNTYDYQSQYDDLIKFYELLRINWSNYDLKTKRDNLERLFLMIHMLKEEEKNYIKDEMKLTLKKTN